MKYEAYIVKNDRTDNQNEYFVYVPDIEAVDGYMVLASSLNEAFQHVKLDIERAILKLRAAGKQDPIPRKQGWNWSKRLYWRRDIQIKAAKHKKPLFFDLETEIEEAKRRAGLTDEGLAIIISDINIIERVSHVYVAIETSIDGKTYEADGTAECGKKDTFNPFVGLNIALFRAVKNLAAQLP